MTKGKGSKKQLTNNNGVPGDIEVRKHIPRTDKAKGTSFRFKMDKLDDKWDLADHILADEDADPWYSPRRDIKPW
jgi:hypothetical protein